MKYVSRSVYVAMVSACAAALLLAWPCQIRSASAEGQVEETLVLEMTEDKEAIKPLAELLRKHSDVIEVIDTRETTVSAKDSDHKFSLSPKLLSGEGLDRIILTAYFTGGSNRSQLIQVANDLNSKYNAMKFAVDSDGDLQVQQTVTFVNRLTWAELRAFLIHHRDSLRAIVISEQNDLKKVLR